MRPEEAGGGEAGRPTGMPRPSADPASGRSAARRRRAWFERRFPRSLPVEALPDIVERLRGTPARLEERLDGVPARRITGRDGGRWSIQENAGHLLDLEPLWAERLGDLEAGRETLAAADLSNRATHEANHDARPLGEILAAFRAARRAFVGRLEAMDDDALRRTALHPRLREPMSAVDLAHFVAEHDDHHLARITELLRGREPAPPREAPSSPA